MSVNLSRCVRLPSVNVCVCYVYYVAGRQHTLISVVLGRIELQWAKKHWRWQHLPNKCPRIHFLNNQEASVCLIQTFSKVFSSHFHLHLSQRRQNTSVLSQYSGKKKTSFMSTLCLHYKCIKAILACSHGINIYLYFYQNMPIAFNNF